MWGRQASLSGPVIAQLNTIVVTLDMGILLGSVALVDVQSPLSMSNLNTVVPGESARPIRDIAVGNPPGRDPG
jgi:hypothetical protein